MKGDRSIVTFRGVFFSCRDCPLQWHWGRARGGDKKEGQYLSIRSQAQAHTRKTGHVVLVERTRCSEMSYREKI